MATQVLLIDDSKVLQTLVATELAKDGLEVCAAYDGAEGLRLARELQPAVILLDVCMPGIDGYEVCETLGGAAETARIPVLFLSAASDPADRVRGLNQGATDYIVKPFSGEELRARVRVWLRYRYLMEQESRRAMRDAMTGLWNRAYFDERLTSEAAAALRHARPLACVIADIDRFKSINDAYGHPFGDRAIRAVADRFSQSCRREDAVCRWGGEEFAVLCPGVDEYGAGLLAERLRRAVAEHVLDGPAGRVPLTCSFGVADLRDGAERMVAAADAALYAAKQAGRNCVCRPKQAA